MLQVRVKCSESNRIKTSVLPAGHHYIPVELDEVVFFMRKGHLLPLAKDSKEIQSVADVDFALLDNHLFTILDDNALVTLTYLLTSEIEALAILSNLQILYLRNAGSCSSYTLDTFDIK
ncbi:glycosyl hydrolase, family 31 [human gut metagenome]|uniref:Glycosyl hydrolase, family 31 n=1 Tax=human gut metagenome TaxID=408170 RepID=K1RUK2_9ZZZZ